ncbi:hypothetical protein SLEP1_g48487 [Rubroshorea leprosula]|uniref:Uncharacterized protein n=1 Tax=Rubroshorea leprosula TaxID=152421 RepID=A0AAV5LUM5_9ROSI|nr:hypothetical protein SLEP1_g48487 [Rubroshorea leprosula]
MEGLRQKCHPKNPPFYCSPRPTKSADQLCTLTHEASESLRKWVGEGGDNGGSRP